MIDKRKLEMDAAVKIVQEITPVLKNGILIFILCQLVIYIVKTDGFGIIPILHPANPVPCHFPVRNRLLGGQPLFFLSFFSLPILSASPFLFCLSSFLFFLLFRFLLNLSFLPHQSVIFPGSSLVRDCPLISSHAAFPLSFFVKSMPVLSPHTNFPLHTVGRTVLKT